MSAKKRTPGALALLGGAALVGALSLGAALPASAHNYLVSSNPTADSVVTELPDAFSVTTNEALLDLTGDAGGFLLQVRDAAGLYYGDGCLAVDGSSLITGATLGEAGDYSVVWQVVSADGHPVSGEFAFSWQPTDQSLVSVGWAEPPVCGATQPEAPIEMPTASPEPTPSETAVPISEPIDSENTGLTTGLWIGGALIAVLAAAGGTLLAVRRRSGPPTS